MASTRRPLTDALAACDGISAAIENRMKRTVCPPDYDSLPEAIKAKYTEREWAWLGEERNRAIERETMPDGPPE